MPIIKKLKNLSNEQKEIIVNLATGADSRISMRGYVNNENKYNFNIVKGNRIEIVNKATKKIVYLGTKLSDNNLRILTKELNKSNNKNQKQKVMAEAKKSTPKAGAKKRSKVRTDEQLLKGSRKEKLYAFIRTAFNVEKGAGAKFTGSKRLAKSKAPASIFSGAGKKKSFYWDIDVKDPRFVEFDKAMVSAQSDIKAGNFSPKVAKAMDLFLGLQRAGGGTRTKTPAKLGSYSL